jgi:hypothetical protein
MVAPTTKAQNPAMAMIMTTKPPHPAAPPHPTIVSISLLGVSPGDRLTLNVHLGDVDIARVSMKVC